jgi:hypothetical protein
MQLSKTAVLMNVFDDQRFERRGVPIGPIVFDSSGGCDSSRCVALAPPSRRSMQWRERIRTVDAIAFSIYELTARTIAAP